MADLDSRNRAVSNKPNIQYLHICVSRIIEINIFLINTRGDARCHVTPCVTLCSNTAVTTTVLAITVYCPIQLHCAAIWQWPQRYWPSQYTAQHSDIVQQYGSDHNGTGHHSILPNTVTLCSNMAVTTAVLAITVYCPIQWHCAEIRQWPQRYWPSQFTAQHSDIVQQYGSDHSGTGHHSLLPNTVTLCSNMAVNTAVLAITVYCPIQWHCAEIRQWTQRYWPSQFTAQHMAHNRPLSKLQTLTVNNIP